MMRRIYSEASAFDTYVVVAGAERLVEVDIIPVYLCSKRWGVKRVDV